MPAFFQGINILAILLATGAGMLVGFLWYGPLFGNAWMREAHIDPERMKGEESKKAYLLTGFATLIQASILAGLMSLTNLHTVSGGIIVGLLGGVGFTATTIGINFLFESKNMTLYNITVYHHLVVLMVMGAILGAF